ncbi:ATP-dependent RecD-like DNA helicase [Petroclostridium xylanilyticum]|uniref:SF1B family DNA helicase RecD2 n=1 Tax=Petroclostridium xylanilyticum TaxID=1792311 RepID=UPI000B98D356|nr:ATP-dependent RecD-like DNA helicase [Petroclostridium xylanilyticum]
METIEATVEEIVFVNEGNGFTVCDINYNKELVTAVGYMPYLSVGETVKLVGNWVTHHDYGEQFKVEYYERVLPCTVAMIQKYLASGVIKGIREATAQKIVDKFGEKTLEIIENEPERLAEIKGISVKRAAEIGQSFWEQREVRKVVMFLQQYGVTPNYAVKVYKKFGNDAIDQIKKNPYILSEEIYGIGFKTADKIALSMGIELNDVERVKAGVKYVLTYNNSSGGHTFLPKNVLVQLSAELLQVSVQEIEYAIISMMVDKSVYVEKMKDMEAVYLAPFHHAEMSVARRLMNIAFAQMQTELQDIDREIADIEQEIGITLADQQREAVKEALCNGVLVITGGPGTGKTTTINTIIKLMEKRGYSIALAAPTGRASKRMSEMTGKEAKTIHRLLEIGYMDEGDQLQFARDESNPLDIDVVIIDETSMVDILLMNGLLKAITPGARLVMVGDVDQLPSVGPGNVLRDIIESGMVKVVRLTEIFRQAQESMIIVNAHRINKGDYPLLNVKDKDFYFMARDTAPEIVSSIVELCKHRLPAFYGYDSIQSIQVLTPMRKSPVGIINLNAELQKVLNPPSKDKKEKVFRDCLFREGDKVMQIKNNYNIRWERISDQEEGTGVFNGDVGYIQKINDEESTMTIIFDDDKKVEYDYNQLDELELAYAITVHKSQGSEFPVVVMPMFPGPPMLMSRNLLYTALTRARELVVLVGKEGTIKMMIDNNREMKRYSGLAEKLRKQL